MKRFLLAVVVFIAVLVPLVNFAVRQDKVYESRSLILFALGWEFVYVPEPNQVGVKAPNPGDFGGFVNAEMLLLDNPRLIRKAIEKVGLERVFPDLPNDEEGMRQAILTMDAATRVELITGSYVVKVAVRHTDPEIAAEVTNALTEAFLDLRRGLYADREVEAVTTRLRAARGEAEAIDAEITSIVGVPDITLYEATLENAGREQARLESQIRDVRLDLVGVQQRFDTLENQLGREKERREAEVLITEYEARAAFMNSELESNREEIRQLSAIMPQLRLLQQTQSRQADRVSELQIRLRDAKAVATSGFDNVRVIEPGVPPLRSVSMSLKTLLAISLAVALMAGAAAFAISMLFDTRRFDDDPEPDVDEAAPANSPTKSKIWVGGKRKTSQPEPNPGAAWPAQ